MLYFLGDKGIDIGFYFLDCDHAAAHTNIVTVTNCVLDSNQAYYGGGTSLFSDPHLSDEANNWFLQN